MPRFVSVEEVFNGRHFDQAVVVLCVRWYLSYKLSYRDLVGMMGERGIVLAHTTILHGYNITLPNSRSAGTGSPERWRFLAHGRNVRKSPRRMDAYAASHRAVTDLKQGGELPRRVRVRSGKYLNNAIEQDHRRVKQRRFDVHIVTIYRLSAAVA